jgi:hypothetical protein
MYYFVLHLNGKDADPEGRRGIEEQDSCNRFDGRVGR